MVLGLTVSFQFSIFLCRKVLVLHGEATSASIYILFVSDNLSILVHVYNEDILAFQVGDCTRPTPRHLPPVFNRGKTVVFPLSHPRPAGLSFAAKQKLTELSMALGRVTSAKHHSLYARQFPRHCLE